ncbi:MAG: hypothetical protein EOP45_11870 [Sphingobacteriaceae bacterium]|nr:MAG: hypothetical protein EOP45_11870 [Sphingobacteriaceae bacterium]
MVEFTEKHKADTSNSFGDIEIDWTSLATDYDGILISPYQYCMRLRYLWFGGWDCASGCIWNLSCIDSLKNEK